MAWCWWRGDQGSLYPHKTKWWLAHHSPYFHEFSHHSFSWPLETCSGTKGTIASGKDHLALAIFRCFSCPRASWGIRRHPRMSQGALGQLKHLKTARARWPFPDDSSQSSSPHSSLPCWHISLHFPWILGLNCHLHHYHPTTEQEDHCTIMDTFIPFVGALSKF